MEDAAYPPDWRERLRDELLPYAAFYALGLMWLSVAGTIGAWNDGWGFALLALTATFGIPVTALVSLMMIWRVAMLGIDVGRVVPMVVAVSSSIALLIAAFGAVFPILAFGHWFGEHQRAILAPAR